jgi:hypothetical protein
MAFDGSFHFSAVAIVRTYEVGTDKQEDDIGALQVLMDFSFPLLTSIDISIAPERDLALPLV